MQPKFLCHSKLPLELSSFPPRLAAVSQEFILLFFFTSILQYFFLSFVSKHVSVKEKQKLDQDLSHVYHYDAGNVIVSGTQAKSTRPDLILWEAVNPK